MTGNSDSGKQYIWTFVVVLVCLSFAFWILFKIYFRGERAVSNFLSLAQRPPMGWNSWDCFGPTVTEEEVKANADYMAKNLKQFGWEYIVVDGRWFVENTTAHGYNQTNPIFSMDDFGRLWPAVNRFPSSKDGKGFGPLAEYVHKKGLKFGIHLMRGIPVLAVKKNTPIFGTDKHAVDIHSTDGQCVWLQDMYTIVPERPGAQEYYDSVFKLYASWGVDYVKVDDLSSPYRAGEIEMIRAALDKCGREIVLSMSPGDTDLQYAQHAKGHANLWRISGDVWDKWEDVAGQFGRCRDWAPHIGPGHWPDADMLPLGRIGIRAERGDDRPSRLSKDEQITMMSLWCIFRSPLMFGGHLPGNDDFTLSLLTNSEVIAVNQNSTDNRELFNDEGHIAWTAGAANSRDKYVALFNICGPGEAGRKSDEIRVAFKDIGLDKQCTVRDLWAKKDLGLFSDVFKDQIAYHGAGLYRISPNP